MEAYRVANPKKRRNTLPFLQTIYRRWFYSALIENTPLSPANLVESICLHHNEAATTYPIARQKGKTKFTGINVELLTYSLQSHPIVADLGLLLEYCTPHIDLAEEDVFTAADVLKLGAMLSLNDPNYAAYLLETALWMKLIVKIPSIGVNRFRPAKDAAKRLSAPVKDLFHDIVETTIAMSAKGLQSLVMLPETIFSQSFIRTLLNAPMDTDDIFQRVYEVLGYDMEDLMDITMSMEEDEDMDMDIDILAGTFMTGVLLDKFFFTPFGHFLKLIRPLYVLPFELPNEIIDYVNVSDDPEEVMIAFFAPCSNYTLTDLGIEYFGVEKTADNYFDTANVLPFAQMKNTVFSCDEALHIFVSIGKRLGALQFEEEDEPEAVHTFRVRREDNPSLWAHLQMPACDTLHDMYVEIAHCMDLKDNNDYTFYHDKVENRFAEYTSIKRSKGGKKTADTPLEEIDFEHQKKMLLVAYNQAVPFSDEAPTVRLHLELLHTKDPEPGYEYPRVSRASKALMDI